MAGELTQTFARHGTLPESLAKANAHAAPTRALLLTGAAASLILVMNYTESMAKGFAFLSVVVTAANLPLYLFCALAILVLWRRGEISRPTRREMLLLFAGCDCDRLFDLAVRRRWYQVVVVGRCSGPGRCAGLLVDASQPDVCVRIARWGVTWREWAPLRDDPSDQSPFVVSRSLCSRRLRAARAHLKRPSLALPFHR